MSCFTLVRFNRLRARFILFLFNSRCGDGCFRRAVTERDVLRYGVQILLSIGKEKRVALTEKASDSSYRDLYMVKQREFAIVSISLVRVLAVFAC